MKAGFKAVSELVKSWRTGDYVHHVRHLADKGTAGHEFLVIFSIPQPTKPVPEHVANATFTVRMPSAGDEEEAAPKISYTMETQHQRLDGSLPIRKVWLDAAVRRKRKVLADSRMFAQASRLPAPVAFVPGAYKAEAAVVATLIDGAVENEERLMDAMCST